MVSQVRSPNYPSLSLREAVDKVRSLHDEIGQHATTRDVVARGMGYRGLSGSSASAISAAKKYGLLEGRGEEIRVSDRAMAIIAPHDEDERKAALRAAAMEPGLFRELTEKFPGGRINIELLKNHLIRNRFSPQAVPAALSAYQDTLEFIGGFSESYELSAPNRDHETPSSDRPDQQMPPLPGQRPAPAPPPPLEGVEIGALGFKGVGFVKIIASPELNPRKALAMAEQVIAMMRLELDSQSPVANAEQENPEED